MKKELIKLQQDFKALYGNGLVGISDSYIQITSELFTILFADDIKNISLRKGADTIELRYEENGVIFLTLL